MNKTNKSTTNIKWTKPIKLHLGSKEEMIPPRDCKILKPEDQRSPPGPPGGKADAKNRAGWDVLTSHSHRLPSQPPPVSAKLLPDALGLDPTLPQPAGCVCSEKLHRLRPRQGERKAFRVGGSEGSAFRKWLRLKYWFQIGSQGLVVSYP